MLLTLPKPPLTYDPQNEAQMRLAIEQGFLSVSGSGSGGFTNPMTAKGDIIIGDTGGAPKRLAAGPNGNVLIMQSGAPIWSPSYSGAGGVTIDPAWDSVYLLLHLNGYTGGTLVDSKGHSVALTGTALSSTAFGTHPYGVGTVYTTFAGGTDKVVITTADIGRYRGSQNYTLEFWFCCSTGTANQVMFAHANGNNNNGTLMVVINTVLNNGLVQLQDIGNLTITGTVSHIDGQWHHLRFVRSWDVGCLMIDGVVEANTQNTFAFRVGDFAGNMQLGASPAAASPTPFVGAMEDFRLTIGVSRGVMPFATPKSLYPDG